MRIDIFPHILPLKYKEAIIKTLTPECYRPFQLIHEAFPSLTELDTRFGIMDRHGDLVQVLTLTIPFVESVAEPGDAVKLAKLGNDELAELVQKYPDRFVAAIGNLPMNDMDAALDELDRIVNELHFRGVQMCTNIDGKPMDAPEFMPLYENMERYNLPILIHPSRLDTTTDYSTENASKYDIYSIFGWPYETSAAMTRLVFGHVLEKYPNLKFITHHCGAMVPYFEQRISAFYNYREMRGKGKYNYNKGLTKSPLEYFKMFYADTALNGSTPGLMCGYAFFGADHILFGTDMPYDSQNGHLIVKQTIDSVEQMDIPDSDKKKIFEDNARRLFRLPI
ncbi:amidohydrolase family protein [Chloroflexota bacterium]